jgi:hypothetical protein
VGADQDFEAFLREWAEEYIWPVEDFLDDRDQAYLAERRSIELVQLTQKKGFSNELAESGDRLFDPEAPGPHPMACRPCIPPLAGRPIVRRDSKVVQHCPRG